MIRIVFVMWCIRSSPNVQHVLFVHMQTCMPMAEAFSLIGPREVFALPPEAANCSNEACYWWSHYGIWPVGLKVEMGTYARARTHAHA